MDENDSSISDNEYDKINEKTKKIQPNPTKEDIENEDNQDVNEKSDYLKSAKKLKKGFRAFNFTQSILDAIFKFGYKYPTPIQKKVIPEIMTGFNIIAKSRTGSGKTAAFLLPILNQLKEHSTIVGTRCLILVPTRELAYQTLEFCKKFGKGTNLKYALLVGGNEIEGQFEKLAMNPDIIIATPGRVFHHITEGSLSLKKCRMLVIDEADKLFETGSNYEEQLNLILKNCSVTKQVALFSATINNQLSHFIKTGIRDYKMILLDEEGKIPEKLKIHMIYCRSEEKKYGLLSILKAVISQNQSTLLFAPTKTHCEMLQEFLTFWNIPSVTVFGNMDQEARNINIDKFRKNKCNLLIVTDVAARGIDIPFLDNVINYDFPDRPKLFIHRVGRTARAGREGRVFSLITNDDLAYFFDLKVHLGKEIVYKYEDQSSINKGLNDCNYISFGIVPQKIMDSVINLKIETFHHKSDIEYLEESAGKAYSKYLRFKLKPSLFGVKQAKGFKVTEVHPLFFDENSKTEEERERFNFIQELKKFKPKSTILEKANTEEEKKLDLLKKFNTMAESQRSKKQREDEIEKEIEKSKQNEKSNDRVEKENNNNELIGNKRKRSQMRNFRDNPHFIHDKADTKKNLWGNEKPIDIEELTMNIIPDDDANLSKKQKFVWDPKKKNFTYARLDESGKIIRKQEKGVNVNKKDKFQAYKNWKKKTKLKIQSVGEVENNKIVTGAFENIKEKSYMKNTKQKKTVGHGKFNKEIKNFDQLVKQKKSEYVHQNRQKSFKKEEKLKKIKNAVHQNQRSRKVSRGRGKGRK